MTSFVYLKVSRLCVFIWYVIACNVGLFCIYQVSRFFGLGIYLKTRTEIFCAFIEIYRHLLPTRTHTYIHAHQAAMAGLDCVALFDGSWLRPLIYINVYIHTHTQNVTPLFCTFTWHKRGLTALHCLTAFGHDPKYTWICQMYTNAHTKKM